MATVRDLLNRLRWDPVPGAGAVDVEVRFRDGGVERSRRLAFADVVEILPGGLTVADGTFIPYHRVVKVRRGEEVLWRSGRA